MSYTQYSSFQIAKMLNVSRQAVNQWIDKGYIVSYRTPGGHRRVARRDLFVFLHGRNIPIPPELESLLAQEAREPALDVVLIDDDEDFLILLEQALSEALPQARIRKFANGLDGLIAIGAEVPHLLLLDMRMPGLDGIEVIKRLKTNPLTATLPILVITAYDDHPSVQTLRRMHVERVISKAKPLMEITQEILDFLAKPQQIAH
jgi:excisionase family DNA binding protein